MKEIKFKAWDKKIQQFIDANEIVINDGKIFRNWQYFEDYIPDEGTIELVWATGRKDKNGVEVYEGDILLHPLQGKRKVFYPYSETVASYGLRNVENGMGSTLQDAHRVWEIIGNIYENPELLKEEPTC